MMWKDGKLFALTPTGEEDELGNQTKELTELWSGQLRFSPWTDVDVSVNGREVTQNEQRYAVPVPYSVIKQAEQAEFDGVMLKVNAVCDLGARWTMIQVKVHKQ